MATDANSTRPAVYPDEPARVETTPTSAVTPSGVDGVAVYDGESDTATRSSESMTQDPTPITTRSNSTLIAWIIAIVILVILAYFLWQIFF